jgi:hypothetical protein
MIEVLQRYLAACESNLKTILITKPIDQRAVVATQGAIDDLKSQIEGLLI